jgi:hypothetical protein
MTKINIINIVKRRLWCSGYAVSERSREVDGFDLIVDGKHRVCVGEPTGSMDVLAKVQSVLGHTVIRYANEDKAGGAREIFGLPIKKEDHGKKNRKEVTPKGSGKEVSA